MILATTSRYRADPFRRFGIDFTQQAPAVDEADVPGEGPSARARHLAVAKASAIQSPTHAVAIGSDQVSTLHGLVQHKLGNNASACAQLLASSGSQVIFHTAVCVRDSRTNEKHTHVDRTTAHFRELDQQEIERYVEREQPLDCASSFKCEGLGIALFTHINTQDPTALIGLPLIALAQLLRRSAVTVV